MVSRFIENSTLWVTTFIQELRHPVVLFWVLDWKTQIHKHTKNRLLARIACSSIDWYQWNGTVNHFKFTSIYMVVFDWSDILFDIRIRPYYVLPRMTLTRLLDIRGVLWRNIVNDFIKMTPLTDTEAVRCKIKSFFNFYHADEVGCGESHQALLSSHLTASTTWTSLWCQEK